MAASNEHLVQLLEQLHAELSGVGEDLDPAVREELAEVAGDIRRVLQQPNDAAAGDSEHSSFAARLQEATQQFEDEHPHLITAVNAVADALSRLGI